MPKTVERPSTIETRKIAVFDLEGTLTHKKRRVPADAGQETMMKILEEGERPEGSHKVGYWSGINLLGGEHPEAYFERVEKWENLELSDEQYEAENIQKWREAMEFVGIEQPEAFIDWYNKKFLDLRKESRELVEACASKGFKTAILSHTSTGLSLEAAERLGIDYVFPSWSFNVEGGEFRRPGSTEYAEKKGRLLEDLRRGNPEEVWFIGNGKNDFGIANRADRAFMITNQNIDYSEVEAFKGSFEDVFSKVKEVKA